MPKVNYTSLNHILKLLDIPNSVLIQKLFVSQSLVSRWKTGSRALSSNSPIYENLLNLILCTDEEQGLGKLEAFLRGLYTDRERGESAIPKLLRRFLLTFDNEDLKPDCISLKREATVFKVYHGREERKEAIRTFFDKALSFDEPRDLYVFDAENYMWADDNWNDEFRSRCLECMEAGIKIYIFSSLYGLKKENFYRGWQFTNHYNLYPGYYSEHHSDRAFYSHYLIEGSMSVLFYSPGNNPEEDYTAVYTDPQTCKIHYQYLKNKYGNASRQISLSNINERNFALNTVDMHMPDSNPLVAAGKLPSFVLAIKSELTEITGQAELSRERKALCSSFHGLFAKCFAGAENKEVEFLYYLEDLEAAAEAELVQDLELSAISGCEVFVTNAQIRSRFRNAAEILRLNKNVKLYIIRKDFAPVYSSLGEMITLWCKRNKWCLLVDERLPLLPKMILDNTACSLRREMFHELVMKIPEEISSRERSIEILSRLSAN